VFWLLMIKRVPFSACDTVGWMTGITSSLLTPAPLKPRLHDTACCQTGLTTGKMFLYTGCIVHTTGCQTHLTTGLTTGCIVYTAGCTTRFDNRLNKQYCPFNAVVQPV